MSKEKPSLTAAVEEAVEEQAIGDGMMGGATSAQQLDMLRDEETGSLPDDVFSIVRNRGRPPGARNKRNEKIAKMIVQAHGDPLMELASIGFMPLDQLTELQAIAAGLGGTERRLTKLLDQLNERLDAKDLGEDQRESLDTMAANCFRTISRIAARKADFAKHAMTVKKDALVQTAPYVHGKQPIEINHNGRPDLILNIEGMTDMSRLVQDAELGQIEEADFQDIRFVSDEGADGSEAEDAA